MGFFLIFRAILVRSLFACHGTVVLMALQEFNIDKQWYLATALAGLLMETLVTLVKKKGQEWQWFCPSIFFYLLSVVPTIWLSEINVNSPKADLPWKDFISETIFTHISSSKFQQQILLFILIMGRWIMPKGKLTRDQLSQLLLSYIGTAADIVDFFDSLREQVQDPKSLKMAILAIWSLSLLQFAVVIPAAKPSVEVDPNPKVVILKPRRQRRFQISHDALSILFSICLQDLPFLSLRLVLIFHFEVRSQAILFFTAKNTLVSIMMSYRLLVIFWESRARIRKAKRAERELTCRLHNHLRYVHRRFAAGDTTSQTVSNQSLDFRFTPQQPAASAAARRRFEGIPHTSSEEDTATEVAMKRLCETASDYLLKNKYSPSLGGKSFTSL